MEERQHGDTLEHHHEGYEYWHPASRVHSEQPDGGLPRGLQVKPFDWAAWDQGCEAKGICQGYITKKVYYTDNDEDWHTRYDCSQPNIIFSNCDEWHQPPTYREELHHRNVAPDCIGLAEAYWQCPHCRQLQKPIQWIQGARLETYYVEVRGNRTVVWVKVSSGAWFVLVIRAEGSLQGVAMGICQGTVYFCGIPDVSEAPPLQLPDECSTILARRMWHKLTKGYWSDRNKEDC